MRQFSEFVVTDLSFGGGSKIAPRARIKARLTPLSKQAISRGYVVDCMNVFRLGLLKKHYQTSVKGRRHLKEISHPRDMQMPIIQYSTDLQIYCLLTV